MDINGQTPQLNKVFKVFFKKRKRLKNTRKRLKKKEERPQLNKVFKVLLKNGNASNMRKRLKKKRGNTSTINIGKQLKNIQKYLTLFQFWGISQNKVENPQKWILVIFDAFPCWDVSVVRHCHSTFYTIPLPPSLNYPFPLSPSLYTTPSPPLNYPPTPFSILPSPLPPSLYYPP